MNFQSASGRAVMLVAWSKAQTFWTTVMYRRCKRSLKGSVTALLLSGSLIAIFFITMEKHSAITLRTQPDNIVGKDATALNVHSTCSTGGWITICFSYFPAASCFACIYLHVKGWFATFQKFSFALLCRPTRFPFRIQYLHIAIFVSRRWGLKWDRFKTCGVYVHTDLFLFSL